MCAWCMSESTCIIVRSESLFQYFSIFWLIRDTNKHVFRDGFHPQHGMDHFWNIDNSDDRIVIEESLRVKTIFKVWSHKEYHPLINIHRIDIINYRFPFLKIISHSQKIRLRTLIFPYTLICIEINSDSLMRYKIPSILDSWRLNYSKTRKP